MTKRMKDIVLIQVVIILLLLGVDYSSQALAGYITQDLHYGYSIKLNK